MMVTTKPSVGPRPGGSASALEICTASTCSVAQLRRCPPASASPAWCHCHLHPPLPRRCPQKLVPLGHHGWRLPRSGRTHAEDRCDGSQPGPGTSPLSIQPSASCLSGQGQSSACVCFSARTNRCRSAAAMDRKGCSPFCLCTPLLSPAPRASCLWLFCPPHLTPARLWMCSPGACSIPGGSAAHQRSRDAPQVGYDIWKPFSCLVHVANMP